MDAVLSEQSFGQALGALILRKRRAAGLTQIQLAEDAFNTTGKTRRISELENGQVDNPHPTTIDPIIAVLGITNEEIEECTRNSTREVSELDEAFRSARNLIESIAHQFEHARPDASFAELDDFLRAKAREWRALRDRIASLDASDAKIKELSSSAEKALGDGRFDEVDRLLATAEEQHQQTKTLEAVEQQAAIRIARGDASLLREDPDGALKCYRVAARYFEPFDTERMIEVLHDLAHRIYESSLRSLKPRFFIAARLLDDLANTDAVNSDSSRLAVVNYRRGIVYLNEAVRGGSEVDLDLLNQAVSYAREATAASNIQANDYQTVCSHIGLANALMQRSTQPDYTADTDEAIRSLRTARAIAEEASEAQSLLPHVSNSLGAALRSKEAGASPDEKQHLLNQALIEFQTAVSQSELHFTPEVWGASKTNVARVLVQQAGDETRPVHERIFLQIRAIAEYQAAIESFPVTAFPDRFGEAQFELASLLFRHALLLEGELAEAYFMRALDAYQVAGGVFSKEREPYRWATIHMYVGSIFVRHSELVVTANKAFDFEQAKKCYLEAMEVFSQVGAPDHAEVCKNAIKKLRADAKELGLKI